MKIGKESDVLINLRLCVTEITEFLRVSKSSLSLRAKLFLSVVAVRKTLQAAPSQKKNPPSWLVETVLWNLLSNFNLQPLHT